MIDPKQVAVAIPDEEARRGAADNLLDVTHGLVLALQAVLRSDEPLRERYVDALWILAQYLEKIAAGHDVAGQIAQLGIALCDLESGIVDPVLAPGTRVKNDPTRLWRGRM